MAASSPDVVAVAGQALAAAAPALDLLTTVYAALVPDRGESQAICDLTALIRADYSGAMGGLLLVAAVKRLAEGAK